MPKSQRQHEARAALATISQEAWAIHEPALQALIESLEGVARSGELPVAAGFFSPPEPPKNVMGLPSASYSDRVRLAGSTAIVPIMGMIRPRPDVITRWYGGTACSDIRSDVQQAINDPNVKQIILFCDSPGGSVMGLQETADLVWNNRAGSTPIDAFTGGMCASACYYVGSAARRHTADPNSLVGSIGTVMVHADYSRAFKEFGIDVTVVHFGKHKADGSPYRPLGAQGQKTLQEIVDSFGNQFVGAVSRHRDVSPADVRSKFGDGKVFIADEARSLGMIDAVGTLSFATSAPPESTDTDASVAGGSVVSDQVAPTVTGVTVSATSAAAAPRNSTSGGDKENAMDPRIKALLFAHGFVAENASDDQVKSVLTAMCRTAGVTLSENADEAVSQVTKLCAGNSGGATTASTTASTGGAATATTTTDNGTARAQAARDQEIAEARAAGQQAYVERRDSIEALAETINAGRSTPVITAEQIRTAVDGQQTVADIQAAWRQTLTAAGPDNQRINTPITFGQASEDLFAQHAVGALMSRINADFVPAAERPQGGYGELANMSLFQIAQRSLQFANPQANIGMMAREQVASMALQMGSSTYGLGVGARVPFGGVEGSAPAFNRPGDFPHLMSNLMGKLLDRYMALADPTYQHYSDRMPDTDNFKPSIIVAVATFTTLDHVRDGDDYKDLEMSEELQGWIAVNRYGNSVKLTPVMVANDDLDGLMQQIRTLAYAHENTLNSLNLELVTGNVNLPDGNALFSSAHSNIVSSGGAPSATEAEKMKLIHQRQTGINTDKTIRSTPKIVLVPPALETAAEQTYMPISRLVEAKVAQTDASINVHRGRTVHTIAVEPDLENYTNGTVKWWTFDNPSTHRVIAHQFMTGYGRGGRRTTWYDPKSDCRSFALEGRMGVAAAGFRGAAQNNGQ